MKDELSAFFLSAVVIGSAFELGKNCYPKTFLAKCKYTINKKEIKPFIKDDLESFE